MGIDQFQLFGSVVQDLHQEFQRLFYLFLPVFFILAIVVEWFKNPGGSPEILHILKRTLIAMILVVGFQEIAETIQSLCDGVAIRISDLSGIDELIKMAGEKTSNYTMSPMSALLGINDLLIAILSFGSYFILYLAKFVMVALYHFMWGLLTILSPLLILFTLFKGTISIPINLFKSMIEVGCYKIIWAVLSAMLTSLAFGNAYQADGNYLTVIVLNFVVALAMLGTPLVVKSLVGNGLSQMSETLGMGAVLAMAALPAKAAAVKTLAGRSFEALSKRDSKNLGNQRLGSSSGPRPPSNTRPSRSPGSSNSSPNISKNRPENQTKNPKSEAATKNGTPRK